MGPYHFKVTSDPAILTAYSDGKKLAGFSNLETALIGIADDKFRSHAYKADTLLHELIHMAFRTSGFAGLDYDAEEAIVMAITPQLLHCLRENLEVLDYLTYRE